MAEWVWPKDMHLEADVVVVGAGPAGATAALMLAAYHRVLLVDRANLEDDPPHRRVGESLPAAAGRLLRTMGLLESFQQQGHTACFGARSLWGGPKLVHTDSTRNLDGPGWHLDRHRFDRWLRQAALERGAALLGSTQANGVTRQGDGWVVSLSRGDRCLTVRSRWVVDAGGRVAPLARLRGQKPVTQGRLVCRWCTGSARGDAGVTVTIAEPQGWWYTAALPAGRRILAFYTDADLTAAKAVRQVDAFMACAQRQPDLGTLLEQVQFAVTEAGGFCAAHSSWSPEAAGPGWLAVGDAALSCDPLSSQGLLNALYSGVMAAQTLTQACAGDATALDNFNQGAQAVKAAYRSHLAAWYGMETRWSNEPFWRRRQAS